MANDKFSLGPVERGTDVPNRNGVLWVDTSTTPDTVKIQVNESNAAVPEYVTFETGATAGGGGTPNDLLDGSAHQDTTAGTVVRGDIITGQGATPTWSRLAKGASATVLTMGANEPAWTAPATQTSALLSATHTDTTAAGPTRGDIITAQDSSPTWKRLAKGSQAQVLRMGANEPEWGTIGTGGHLGYDLKGRFLIIATTFGFSRAIGTTHKIERGNGSMGTVSTSSIPVDVGEQCYYCSSTASIQLQGNTSVSAEVYPYFRIVARVEDSNDFCTWMGLFNSTPGAGPDPTNHCAAFRWKNGVDTNWMAVTRDGTTTGATDTTVAPDTSAYKMFEIYTPDGGTTWKFYINRSLVATRTTELPTVTSTLLTTVRLHILTAGTGTIRIKSILTAVGDTTDADAFTDEDFGISV
jgi:hypothetical protein